MQQSIGQFVRLNGRPFHRASHCFTVSRRLSAIEIRHRKSRSHGDKQRMSCGVREAANDEHLPIHDLGLAYTMKRSPMVGRVSTASIAGFEKLQ